MYDTVPNDKSAGLPVYCDSLPTTKEQRALVAPEHIIAKPIKWIPRAQAT